MYIDIIYIEVHNNSYVHKFEMEGAIDKLKTIDEG